MLLPLLVVLIVFILIAARRIGSHHVEIWQVMGMGALAVLITGQISIVDALISINMDVMLFLFGMFVLGVALEDSGYLLHISHRIFRHARNGDQVLLLLLFSAGFASAILMNDTLAIIGTPLVLFLAKVHRMNSKILLLGLAYAVTIGSAMSPIGNPQNLLIAINGGMEAPFVTFFMILLLPTVANLIVAFVLLKLLFKSDLECCVIDDQVGQTVLNHRQARACRISLIILLLMICVKVILVSLAIPVDFRLTYIALASAAPVLLAGPHRFQLLRRVDWKTLIFFAAMFVLMQSVWDSGVFQALLESTHIDIVSIPMIFLFSVTVSQLISNVPLVALYLPLLLHAGAGPVELVALAAGSTIAGNLTILGAASNVIVIQNAEDKADITITLAEFMRVGVPLTVLNILVYMAFFTLFSW